MDNIKTNKHTPKLIIFSQIKISPKIINYHLKKKKTFNLIGEIFIYFL